MRISKPSPALIVAIIALVMSTAGTTIAATTLLPRSSVGGAQLRTGSVDGLKIRDRSITIRDLAAATTAALKLPAGPAGGSLGGSYPSPTIAPGAITSATIAPGAVTSVTLADGAVTASKLAAGAITVASLPDDAIGGSKIMSGSIDSTDLVPNEAWHVVGDSGSAPFAAMWGSSSLGLYDPLAYRKDRFGTVHLRGVAWRSTTVTGSTVFTLPEGYRPLRHHLFASASSSGGRIGVDSNGQVWVSEAVNEDHAPFDGVHFVAGE